MWKSKAAGVIEDAQHRKQVVDSAELPTNASRPLFTGLIVLLLGFGGFLLWASLAPLDAGVPASGTVVLDGRRKVVQHLSGGLISKILVKEGEVVTEQAVLARLDNSLALASKATVESQLNALKIQIAYLGKLASDLDAMTAEGFYPKNKLLEIQRQRSEAMTQQSALEDRLRAASLELERTIIRAPAKGRVMGLALTTEGAVIAPGGKLLEIVPEDERLVVEAQIQPHLIDRVYPGIPAEVRFSTLNMRATPVIMGTIEWVSGDRFVEQQDHLNPMGYFTARIVVSSEELKKLPDVKIRPGMIADVVIKTGERTFFNYVMRPLVDRMAMALREW